MLPKLIFMRHPLRTLTLLAVLLAVAAGTSSLAADEKAGAAPKPAKGDKAEKTDKAAPESLLKKGMSVSEVKKIMGEPEEIQPMKVDAALGKAEIWTYKREAGVTTSYVQIGNKVVTITVKGADGVDRQVPVSIEPELRMQRTYMTDLIQVLMFNDHYAEKQVTTQSRREFP